MKERKLEVYLGERFVGTMAQTADRRVAFAYSEEWLDNGFAISPFSLPVEQKVFVPTSQKIIFEVYSACLQTACRMRGGSCWSIGC